MSVGIDIGSGNDYDIANDSEEDMGASGSDAERKAAGESLLTERCAYSLGVAPERRAVAGVNGREGIRKIRMNKGGTALDRTSFEVLSFFIGKEGMNMIDIKENEQLSKLNHSCAHMMAQAVKRLYPQAKFWVGPVVSEGFYYDMDLGDKKITDDDLPLIEKEMKKIAKDGKRIVREEISKAEALEMFKDDEYKLDLISNLEDGSITVYRQGEFVDLCRGPHVDTVKQCRNFKLLKHSGAYWKGDANNKMLQRIYGVCFETKEELEEHLQLLEEAKKRDHTKLGKELGLFALLNEGKGFPFFLPKGMVLKNILVDYWRQIHTREGYVEVQTPIILNRSLWETSGHWDHYKENMYTTKIDGEDCAIKPMNCPGGMLVYKLTPHSYKDLPIRMGELGIVHRHEKSGQLHGLFRVRCFTQDDAHIFMLPEQIADEIKGVVRIINEVYTLFGFKYHVELSTRPEDSMGSDEDWETATDALRAALDEMGLPYVVNKGDGAFYGPKIDFHLTDSIGRTWQCGTIQLDFQLPQRFEAEYTGEDGQKHRPIMIHRVVFGSIERFIGILIEHYAGKFPVWLSPVQVKILPVSDKSMDYAKQVEAELKAAGVRVETDTRNEKIGYKIREAQLEKLPYMLIIGDKEKEEGTVSVRMREKGDIGAMPLSEFAARVKKENDEKTVF